MISISIQISTTRRRADKEVGSLHAMPLRHHYFYIRLVTPAHFRHLLAMLSTVSNFCSAPPQSPCLLQSSTRLAELALRPQLNSSWSTGLRICATRPRCSFRGCEGFYSTVWNGLVRWLSANTGKSVAERQSRQEHEDFCVAMRCGMEVN